MDGVDDAEVVHRQNIGSAEAEHEEHLGRPASQAFHFRDGVDHLVVGHVREMFQRQLAARGLLTQIPDVGAFLAAQPDLAELRVVERIKGFGRRHAIGEKVQQSTVDRGGRFRGQLLADDRANQRGEWIDRWRVDQSSIAMVANDGSEDRVTAHEQAPCAIVFVRRHLG